MGAPRVGAIAVVLPLILSCAQPGLGLVDSEEFGSRPVGSPLSMAPVLREAMPALVRITAISDVSGADHVLMTDPDLRRALSRSGVDLPSRGRALRRERIGSGLIWDGPSGLVITSADLVVSAARLTVATADGQVSEARLLGVERDADIALLRMRPLEGPSLRRARSERLEVGEPVLLLGHPLGLGPSAASGIVSAVGRVHAQAPSLGPLIQTDAAINPGHAGGLLITSSGELVGIMTGRVGLEGLSGVGFAVPIERVDRAAREILGQAPSS
jgi:S1-C subfamily serine protease